MLPQIFWALVVLLACASVRAQLTTIIDAQGQTIAETISIDPIGNQFTQILSTVFAPTVTTTTVVDPAGQTVVEVISSDPVQGEVVTSTISTIPLATVPTSPATTAGQGPIGAPTSTVVGASTTYTYTTTDGNGATIAVATVFQPTFPPSVGPISLSSASIMAYSDYTASVGTNTVVHNRKSGTSHVRALSSAFLGVCIGVIVGGALVF